ncbi:MAG: sigma-70 family RNA polymerase sigma factor [Bacteroidaceae bacterium]|nr:sigma-70 family RNA polymerase sigma factor [Bacteroidaceae bacterium]
MKNHNKQETNEAVEVIEAVETRGAFDNNCVHYVITEETTLRELLDMLNLGAKPFKTPTARKLSLTAGQPIVESYDCTVYSNGFAVYENNSGRTVIWLPDCTSFTYYFNQETEAEKEYIREKYSLPEGVLESCSWGMAITLVAEHRIEKNLMNRTGSRVGTKDYDFADLGDKDGDAEESNEDSFEDEYVWSEGYIGETPEDAYIRKETRREMLEKMTEKQREVFVMYYYEGLNQYEIAKELGLCRTTVAEHLEGALKKIKKFL